MVSGLGCTPDRLEWVVVLEVHKLGGAGLKYVGLIGATSGSMSNSLHQCKDLSDVSVCKESFHVR